MGRKTQFLERKEEIALARAWLDRGDIRARDRIIAAYRPLIARVARQKCGNGNDLEDLIQEGTIGFMSGLDKFDPDRGYRVGTLAEYHVRERLALYLSETRNVMRLPNSRKLKRLVSSVVAPINAIESEFGIVLTAEERALICEDEGFTLADLEEYLINTSRAKAIQASDDETSGCDPACPSSGAEVEVLQSQSVERFRAAVAEVLATMPERTRTILELRHLSDDFVSLDDLPKRYGVTRERIRQIESNGLAELRDGLRRRGIGSVGDVLGDAA